MSLIVANQSHQAALNNQQNTVFSLFREIPSSISEKIFSYLNSKDLTSATCISKDLHISALASANFYLPESINQYLNAIIFMSKGAMSATAERFLPQNFENIPQLKTFSIGIKAGSVLSIKSIDTNTLKGVKNIPMFWDNIGQLVDIEKKIDSADLLPEDDEKSKSYLSICEKLSKELSFDRALEVAEKMADNRYKYQALGAIAKNLPEVGDFQRALEVAKKIPDNLPCLESELINLSIKAATFRDIAMCAAKRGAITESLEISEAASFKTKNMLLKEITIILADVGDYEKALEVALSIPEDLSSSETLPYDLSSRTIALRYIVIRAAKKGDIDKALEISETASYKIRNLLLSEVANTLVDADKIEQAREVCNRLTDVVYQNQTLDKICIGLARKGDFDKALNIAEYISVDKRKYSTLNYIISFLTYGGDNIDKALEIVEKFHDDNDKFSALIPILNSLVKAKNIDKALEIVTKFPDRSFRSNLINKILYAFQNNSDYNFLQENYAKINAAERGWGF